ncbi:hypothetical protein C2G38_2196671 [Gigaspora rosea]|uniref:Uncharacterized protein n=1 Tax=Gigaspora rosea TaxID=44941 RepID=A0A397UYP7_9GLOM|nr:hypothetical protein C2G38_2196671 [Gigaspora rosea]
MGIEFSNAEKENRRSISQIQKKFIYEYANIEGSLLISKTNFFDYKFKDHLNIRYICFLDEPSLTQTWNKSSNALSLKCLYKYGFRSRYEKFKSDKNIDEIEFIWAQSKYMYITKPLKDKEI